MRRSRTPRYYIFQDENTHQKYFHNAVTNEVTWNPPQDSIIIDPNTLKQIKFDFNSIQVPQEVYIQPTLQKPESKSGIGGFRKTSLPNLNQNTRLHRVSSRKSTLVKLSASASIDSNLLLQPEIPFYLPTSITSDSKPMDIRKFAVENFNTRYRGSIFNKKEIPPDELLVFDMDSSVCPILKSTPIALQKNCVEIFAFIIGYCKQLPKAQPSVFVEMVGKEKQLIDETFIYLLKFIHNNPNPENVFRIWDLILVICTFYPPSPQIQPLVRHYVATDALGTKSGINNVAKMSYIRLAARCDSGETFPMQPSSWINFIPTHPSQDYFIFGAPLLELVFAQRRSAPKCTIPLFMHRFIHELWNAGLDKMEGMFRLPGNKVQVDLMVEEINNGKDSCYVGAELNDLASLFKRWLADMPEPLVPMSLYNELVESIKNHTILDFVRKLPKVNHDTLGYLVGFLQEFVKASDVTNMGIVQCAMLFGANVVRIVSNDPMVMKASTEVGKEFMSYLITNWNTRFIYPLPVEFIT
ncbi:RhoGAP domain containing protein [Trichomonas vaginalis G3]|uniref:RhoGAP domain containing protein n=1 Tax=Trichomonas vaginalis (strain ATCC PRA-98 / G3) TaxID=412133 RepID=A2DMR0_TRIV3|nr:GTPase activator, FI04035P family [Trichomonas vaginalis G3]EAY18281.1 RhoGAP domain containing protein [Trichomonas vaginalis G3]KAI5541899.1 GTPase activator, FI04035P family [Trichomonas vaginalis G3]|eukprot:XP_001579267.1 RhoGAP domain containing protein [Trichomonas vaginalis G3]